MKKAHWLRGIALGLLLALMALAVLTARSISEGGAQMLESDRAFDAGDLRAATLHARRSAVLYAPGAPHVAEAHARLLAIAVGSEAAGDAEVAILAYGALRAAALETRHLWIPYRAELERANQGLARLEARATLSPASRESSEALRDRALEALERDDAPRAPWVVALLTGFALAIAGLALTVVRGVRRDGRLALAPARLGLALTLIGAVCWTLAAFNA